MKFEFGGPPRYAHQRAALRRLIETRGVCALLMDPGCLAGDSELIVNRAGKSFKITLADLVKMQNGGRRSGQKWRADIPTQVQYRAEDGTVRLIEIAGAWSSGEKMTYTVTTSTGRTIRATDEHPFLTSEGWRRLDELRPGSQVYMAGSQTSGKPRQPKAHYREVFGLYAHPHGRKKRHARTGRVSYRVAHHRLVAEARLNGISYADFVTLCSLGPVEGLKFLDPEKYAVHHIDHDHRNNASDNLQVMTHEEHHALHAVEGKAEHVLYKTQLETVRSITPHGIEETYDIEVAGEPHNFIANGFVVHNTGKTAPTLDYLAILAIKSTLIVSGDPEVRVLVISPKSAVDNWVLQAEKWLSPQVNVWAEVLGGSIRQKAETMISRGPQPYQPRTVTRRKDRAQLPHRGLNLSLIHI